MFTFNDLIWPAPPVTEAQYDAAWVRLFAVCNALGLDAPTPEEIEFQATNMPDIKLSEPYVYCPEFVTGHPVKINVNTGQRVK